MLKQNHRPDFFLLPKSVVEILKRGVVRVPCQTTPPSYLNREEPAQRSSMDRRVTRVEPECTDGNQQPASHTRRVIDINSTKRCQFLQDALNPHERQQLS